MNSANSMLLANAFSTLFMVGLIWMVQVVHYPLFDDVGETNYVQYQQRHQTNITLIVGPMMLIELLTAVGLIWIRPDGIHSAWAYSGLALVAIIWLSTALIQVPCHEVLVKGFEQEAYRKLVNSNWIRTIAWTVRGGIVTWMLALVISK